MCVCERVCERVWGCVGVRLCACIHECIYLSVIFQQQQIQHFFPSNLHMLLKRQTIKYKQILSCLACSMVPYSFAVWFSVVIQ